MKLHDTRTNVTVTLQPITPGQVSLYTCGPTVYSEPTIGNWVAYIRWDLLVRTLLADGYDVKRVMNITDVGHLTSDADDGEDKLQKGARRDGVTAWEVARRYTDSFMQGMAELALLPPGIMSKATEHIEEQIDLIRRLEAGGHTYIIDDGVYFDTTTFTSYADFAHLDLAALKAGARVSMNTQKRNPSDFALWKFSPTDEQRDMEWDSPWAPPGSAARKGFPGWHIECSAMAMKYLGDTLDIHTGGIDHIPVHHTNEIAQSEAATGKPFANIWTHANFLLVNGTKISKSLGNGFTLADLADKGFSAMDFKLFVLQSNYRTESNFTWDNLAAARNRLLRWRTVACLRHQVTTGDTEQSIEPSLRKVHHSLTDDLNSPVALTHIDELMDQILQQPDSFTTATLERLFERLDDALGLRLIETSQDVSAAVRALIDQRLHARESKDWQRSDSLRDELKSQGIGVNDTAAGSNWYYL